jgi:membrane associated rhomboid family serine protease
MASTAELPLRTEPDCSIQPMPNQMQEPPPSPASHISARTRREAMDWSLVLASQGIEHSIEQLEETDWALAVAAQDYEKSLTVIRQYRTENTLWRWRRTIFQPGLIFDWSSITWVLLIIIFFWWSEARTDLRSLGRMDGAALRHGEWWRLFTAIWLHADFSHLATNTVFGLMFLGLAMGRYGSGAGLLAAYLAGAGGNVVAWLGYGESQLGLGASGMVMGALGLLTVQSVALLKQRNSIAFRRFTGAIMGGVLLFMFLGLSPGTDVVAHLGGFVAGLLLGSLLALVPRLAHRPRVNLAAGILFATLIILPWLRALSRTG